MRFVLLALLGLFSFWSPQPAEAQTPVALMCYQGPTNPQWAPCPANFPTTNLSSTIGTGNTFQGITGLAALTGGAARRSVTVENNNTTDSCWLFIGATASATKALSILLTPGGSYQRYFPYVPSDNFAITCTTTADTFYADAQ